MVMLTLLIWGCRALLAPTNGLLPIPAFAMATDITPSFRARIIAYRLRSRLVATLRRHRRQ